MAESTQEKNTTCLIHPSAVYTMAPVSPFFAEVQLFQIVQLLEIVVMANIFQFGFGETLQQPEDLYARETFHHRIVDIFELAFCKCLDRRLFSARSFQNKSDTQILAECHDAKHQLDRVQDNQVHEV